MNIELEDSEVDIIIDALSKERVSYSFRTYKEPIIKQIILKLELAQCRSQLKRTTTQ